MITFIRTLGYIGALLGMFFLSQGAERAFAQGSSLTLNGGPFTITPPVNTFTQGLIAEPFISSPSGSTSGPFSYNLIDVVHQGAVCVSGSPGCSTPSGNDSFGLFNGDAAAFRVNLTLQGTNWGQQSGAILGATLINGSAAYDGSGVDGTCYVDIPAAGGCYGMVSFAAGGASAALTHLISHEADLSITSGANVSYGIGFRAVSVTTGQATNYSAFAAAAGPGVSASGFKTLFLLEQGGGFTSPPLDSSVGAFFRSDTAQTVQDFADLGNVTVNGNILNFPNVALTGAGLLALKLGNIGNTSTQAISVQNLTAATSGQVQWSPSIHWQGEQFVSGGSSQSDEWFAELQPTNNAPSAGLQNNLVFSSRINGASLTKVVTFNYTGNGNTELFVNAPSGATANFVLQDNGLDEWHLQNVGGSSDLFQISNASFVTKLAITQAGAMTVTGSLNVTAGYSANGTAGLTCSGSPTTSFASTNGIVTHC